MAKMTVDELADVEKHADATLRECSYHQRDFDLMVLCSRPREMQPVRASLQAAFETLPTAGLGILDDLPAELTSMVLRRLDIRSFFHFRQVNRRARVLSTALLQYELVSKHGLEGLRGLLRADLARRFTMDDLCRPLVTDRCSTCGAFGRLSFLLTAERYCVHRLHAVPQSGSVKLVRMTPSQLERLLGPSLRIVSNFKYTRLGTPEYPTSEEKATQRLLAIGATEEDAIRHLREQSSEVSMAATPYPWHSLDDAKPEPAIRCRGCPHRLGPLSPAGGAKYPGPPNTGLLISFPPICNV